MTRRLTHLLLLLALIAAFAYLLGRAVDVEQARGGVAHQSRDRITVGHQVRGQASGNEREPRARLDPGPLTANTSGRVPAAAYAGGTTRPGSSLHVSVWIRMADCESGDGDGLPPYRATWTFNGLHDGGLQFVPSTWNAAKRLGEVRRFAARYGYAYHAPAWVQIRVADNWRRHTSWAQWPTCSRKLGLR